MPTNNTVQKRAARELQNATGMRYTQALDEVTNNHFDKVITLTPTNSNTSTVEVEQKDDHSVFYTTPGWGCGVMVKKTGDGESFPDNYDVKVLGTDSPTKKMVSSAIDALVDNPGRYFEAESGIPHLLEYLVNGTNDLRNFENGEYGIDNDGRPRRVVKNEATGAWVVFDGIDPYDNTWLYSRIVTSNGLPVSWADSGSQAIEPVEGGKHPVETWMRTQLNTDASDEGYYSSFNVSQLLTIEEFQLLNFLFDETMSRMGEDDIEPINDASIKEISEMCRDYIPVGAKDKS